MSRGVAVVVVAVAVAVIGAVVVMDIFTLLIFTIRLLSELLVLLLLLLGLLSSNTRVRCSCSIMFVASLVISSNVCFMFISDWVRVMVLLLLLLLLVLSLTIITGREGEAAIAAAREGGTCTTEGRGCCCSIVNCRASS